MSTSFQSQGHSGDESHHYYRQALAPTVSDPLQAGDVWSDTTANLLKRCTSISPVTFVSVEGGSSAHDLFSATHGDVDETDTPADNDVLTYDNVAAKWKAEAADGHAHANDHAASHTVASHSDTTATGAETETLTDGSDADSLHTHNGKASTSHAASHADGGADELAVQDLASDAAADGQVAKADGSGAVVFEDDKVSINFIIDGGGSAITTGVKGFIELPFAMTIEGWTVLGDQSGSIVVDVWKDTYGNFPPTAADTIAGTEKPTLSTAVKNQDLALSSWTTAVAAGDIFGFNVDSITTVTRVTVAVRGKKT